MSTENNLPLRQRLGFTQQHFAEYLGISRSMLAMNETKGNMLPSAASLKYIKLELLFIQQNKLTKKAKAPHEKTQAENAIKKLERVAKSTTAKIMSAEVQLENLLQAYERHTTAQLLLQTLQEKNDNDEFDTAWLVMMQLITAKNIEKTGLHAQSQLKLSLKNLQQLAVSVQEQIEELKAML